MKAEALQLQPPRVPCEEQAQQYQLVIPGCLV